MVRNGKDKAARLCCRSVRRACSFFGGGRQATGGLLATEAGKNGADGFHQARRIDVILEEGEAGVRPMRV